MTPPPPMAAPLQGILDAELARGNEIAEVAGWPPTCRLLVILRRPFGANHPLPADVEYHAIDDRHYWLAEYRYRGGLECLACGFG